MRLQLLIPALLLTTLSAPSLAASLFQDTWREDKRGTTLDGLKYWARLTNPDTGSIIETAGRRILRLREGARMQSIGVMPYGDGMELHARLAITSPNGTAGFGFIDFSSAQYFYLYLDRATGRMILQQGDGETSQVLGETPITLHSAPVSLRLHADNTSKEKIFLRASCDGTPPLNLEAARPDKMGSTYQIYVGIGGNTEADFYEVTTIRSR